VTGTKEHIGRSHIPADPFLLSVVRLIIKKEKLVVAIYEKVEIIQ